MASTKRIDLFIRPTSTATKEQAIDYGYDRSNERDDDEDNLDEDGEKIYAHYYYVIDSRCGDMYCVFGDDAQEILSLDKSINILNNEEFLRGSSRKVIIEDGTGFIKTDHDDEVYNVSLFIDLSKTIEDNIYIFQEYDDSDPDNKGYNIKLYNYNQLFDEKELRTEDFELSYTLVLNKKEEDVETI